MQNPFKNEIEETMLDDEELKEIQKRKKEWEEGALKSSLERLGRKESPNRFYTPLDIKNHNFLEKVGFPGEYPFTSGIHPTSVLDESSELLWARGYTGY